MKNLPFNKSYIIFTLLNIFNSFFINLSIIGQENVLLSNYKELKGIEKVNAGIIICEDWNGSDKEFLDFTKELHVYATQTFSASSVILKTAGYLANAYYYNDSLKKSTECLENAVSSAELKTLTDTFLAGNLYNDLGLNYQYSGDSPKAKMYLLTAIRFLGSTDSLKELSDAYSNLGIVYHSEGNYQEAIKYFSKANEIDTMLGDNYRQSSSLNSLGRIYVDWGKYGTGLDYYLRSVELLDTVGYKQALSIRFNNIGMVYQKMNRYDEALIWFRKALHIEEQYGASEKLAIRYANIGNALLKLKKYNEAETYLLRSEIIIEKGDLVKLKSRVYGVLGQLYMAKGSRKKAYDYLLLTLKFAEKSGLPEQSNAYELMYSYYKKTGNYKAAMEYLEKYKQAEDSIFNIEASKQVQRLETMYQSKQKEAEIIRLESENEMQLQKIRYNKRQRNAAIIAVVVFLLISVLLTMLFVTVRKQRETLKKQNDELDKLNKTLNRLFGIISHDLKSATAAYQSSAKIIEYYLDKKQPEKLGPLSAEIRKNASNLSEMLNHLLEWANMQLAGIPVKQENIEVKPEIEGIAELYKKLAEAKGNRLVLNVDQELSVSCDRESFRLIIRNLVNNAIKFTSDGTIEISSSSLPDERGKVTVSDTGCGMPDDIKNAIFDIGKSKVRKDTEGEKGTGLGLVMVAEHVLKNNGTITVESVENKGTSISVIFNKSKL